MEKANRIENSSTMMDVVVKGSENPLSRFPFSGDFDLFDNRDRHSGFIELLGVSDFSPLLDFASGFQSELYGLMMSQSSSLPLAFSSGDGVELPETSPTIRPTPYSCISSSSSKGNDEDSSCQCQMLTDEKLDREKKSLKRIRKKGTKREREPRFVFMTKSDIDHLEDGYRWRKYGQKAVKNSPFPRSYYRCTNLRCSVKKRVERSCEDPSIVITTYEGKHIHQSPATRSAGVQFSHPATPTAPTSSSCFLSNFPNAQRRSPLPLGWLHAPRGPSATPASLTPGPHAPTLLQRPRDDGLLYDILPSGVRD